MTLDYTNLEVLQKKAQTFFDKKLPVHVKFKQGFFKQGTILQVSDEFFELNEYQRGKTLIFYLEIKDIEQIQVKEVGK